MRPTDKELAKLLRKTAFTLSNHGEHKAYKELYAMGNLLDPPTQDDRPDAPRETGHGAWTGD